MASKYSGAVMLLLLRSSVNHNSYAGAKIADGAFTFDQAQVVGMLKVALVSLGRPLPNVACPLLLPMNIDGKDTGKAAEEPVCWVIEKLPVSA